MLCIGNRPISIIGEVDEDVAGDHMRIGHELVDVVDRRGGDLGALEDFHVLGQCARADEGDDRRFAGFGVPDPVAVGAKPRVGDHVFAADRAEQSLGHRLDRGGDADIAAVLRAEHVARRGRLGAAAGAFAHLSGQPVDRRFGRDERKQRVEQGQIDDLPSAALRLDLAQRHHHRKGAVEPGDHVGERRRRQGRLAVGKAGARGVAGHALDQGAEAGPVAVGAVLTPAGNPQDNEARVLPMQHLRPEPHRLERPRTEILDQHLGGGQKVEEQLAPARLAQAHRQALLVARVDLPMHADPVGLPGAQRVAALRILDLHDLGPEIGELQADHIAGDEARHVDDPHAVERTCSFRLERSLRHAHCPVPYPAAVRTRIMLDRILITNDDGIEAPGLAFASGSPPSSPAKSGSSRRSTTRAASRTRSACITRSGSASEGCGATGLPEPPATAPSWARAI